MAKKHEVTKEETSHALTVYDMYQQKMSAVYQQMKITKKSEGKIDGGEAMAMCGKVEQFLGEAIGSKLSPAVALEILAQALMHPLMNGGAGWSNSVAEAFFKVTGVTAKDANKEQE